MNTQAHYKTLQQSQQAPVGVACRYAVTFFRYQITGTGMT